MINQMKHDYNNRSCFVGSCSLSCWANYKISRRSIKLLKEIKDLKMEHDAFDGITETRTVREIPTSSIAVGKIIKSNLEKVRGYLADDNVSMVGIWGMGGVGKTTLLNEINNSLQGGDNNMGFKYVIYLVASQKPQFEKLQEEVSKMLGLRSDSKKSDIFEFLKNKDFLLLLDDIWEAVDLPETIGIPLPHHQSQNSKDRGERYKHKVIFTTREDDVCAQMKSDKRIKVECLDKEEAWHLFKQNANEGFISSNVIIKKLAMKVMEKCSGLPLALKVVGRAMSNKKRLVEWQHMFTSLCKSGFKTIPGMEKSLLHTLKLSYDNLSDKILQECFLCCAQWPEDEPIPVSELIEYWIGFGLIDDFGNIGEAFDKGYVLIGNLNAACLLEFESSFDEDYVKLHDVIRDMALWIVSESGNKKNKWIVGASVDDLRQSSSWEAGKWKEMERILLKGYAVSIKSLEELLCYPSIDEKNQVCVAPASPRYPNLKSIFIQGHYFRFKIVINFFLHMPSLIYLNLSGTHMTELSKDIRVLVNLRYLNISHTRIQSLPPELEELKELKYFIFRKEGYGSGIVDGLSTISRLPKLQVLDLSENTCLGAHDLSLLMGRIKAIGMDVNSVEILGLLKHLPTLNICIYGLYNMPILHFCDLNNNDGEGLMRLNISECDFEELLINGKWVSLKHIKLEYLSKLNQFTWSNTVQSECFQSLTSVSISWCQSLRSLSWVLHLPCLKNLKVQFCSAIEELIGQEMQQASSGLATFPSLLCLVINYMPNLLSLSTCPLDFPVLSTLHLIGCPKLKKLPFKSSIVNNKFKNVVVDEKLWEGLKWEDPGIPSHLFKFLRAPWFTQIF